MRQNFFYRMLYFLGPKWHSLCFLPFLNPKSLHFQGPPLPMDLEMDFPALKSLCLAPYTVNNRYSKSKSFSHGRACIQKRWTYWRKSLPAISFLLKNPLHFLLICTFSTFSRPSLQSLYPSFYLIPFPIILFNPCFLPSQNIPFTSF